jgi:putative ATPase
MAINRAQEEVKKSGNLGVPLPLRNAPTKLMKELGYGQGYLYSQDHPGNFAEQEFLPEDITGTAFFQPGSSPRELEIEETIHKLWGTKYRK